MNARITAFGSYVPKEIITNSDIEKFVETNDEWIVQRTGIKERRKAGEKEYTSDLCIEAAKDLASRYNKDLSDVDFVVVATATPDHVMPSVASQLQHKLGITNAACLDITAACAGFAYGIIVAQGLIASGTYKKVLVFGGETITKFTNYDDRTTCILFGDGAGSILLEASEKGNILNTIAGTNGEGGQNLYLSSLRNEVNGQEIVTDNKIHQDGRKVFKWAVETVAKNAKALMDKANLTPDDIDWFVPHSANLRIIEAIAKQLGFPMEKALESVIDYGNTSSASIPLAIQNGLAKNKIKKGDKLLLFGFGGGLTFAGSIIEWDI